MGEVQREAFLEHFSAGREKSLIGFCVMGGIFAEGIDLKREALIGVIIVGTGLPQINNEREILKNFYQRKEKAGFEYEGTLKANAVKNGVIEEALIETLGCSGMTHSAAMAAEVLPGKTILEALNTDLVCDAINTAMRELFLQIVYGRTQSAFSEDGLPIGAGLEDLGKGLRTQVGTMYSTKLKGVRYLEMAEGYITRIALDENNEVIGYKFVHLGKMMEAIEKGMSPNDAYEKFSGQYGRFNEAVKTINPRKE